MINQPLRSALKQHSVDEKKRHEDIADRIKAEMAEVKRKAQRARTGRTTSARLKEYRRLESRLKDIEALIRCYTVHVKIYS